MIDQLQSLLLNYPIIAPLLFIVLRSLPIIIPPIPGLFLDFLGIAVFGVPGFIFSTLGINLGSAIAFFSARYYKEPLVKRFTSLKRIEEWENKYSEKQQLWTLIILRLTTSPFFDLINYAAGLTKISPSKYLLSTLISTTPVVFIFYYFGGITLEIGMIPFIIFGLVFIVALSLFSKIKKT